MSIPSACQGFPSTAKRIATALFSFSSFQPFSARLLTEDPYLISFASKTHIC
jgi:hypothetical protein